MAVRKRLTQESAERAKPERDGATGTAKETIYWDDKLSGFGLVCRKNGETKTWIAQREVKTERGRKTARTSLGHFPLLSATEARTAAMAELKRMREGYNPHEARAAGVTLAVAFADYLKARIDLRPTTVAGYKYDVNNYLRPILDVPLSDLGKNPRRISELFVNISQQHGRGSANGAMQIFRAVYNREAELNENLPRNPVRKNVIKLHRLKPRTTMISEEQFAEWSAAVTTIQNPIRRALQLFLLLSGMRATATVEMRWEHIDWKKETLRVPEPKGGELYEFTLPLSDVMVTVLRRLQLYSTEGWAFPGSPWVFPSADSASGHIAEVKEQRRAKVVNPHALRRTLASYAADVVPKKHISFLLNHSLDKETITDQYIVRNLNSLKDSQKKITDYLVSKLGHSVENILGPEQSGTKQTFGLAPPWNRRARGEGEQKTSLHL